MPAHGDPTCAPARTTVSLIRVERDLLWRTVIGDLDEPGEIMPRMWPAPDHGEAQAARRRFDLLFALLDAVGWAKDDPRDRFGLTADGEELLAYVRECRNTRAEWAKIDRDEERTSEIRTFDALLARLGERS